MDSMAADEIFRIMPEGVMPPGLDVVYVDKGGVPAFLIREGTSLPDLVTQLNQYATHLVRHGLWLPQMDTAPPPRLRHVS